MGSSFILRLCLVSRYFKDRMLFARLATLAYVIWGLLHLFAAYEVYSLGKTLEEGVIQGRILQDAWNILFFACFGAFVGVKFIWNNQKIGHWLNWVVVSAGDIGFILTLLVPGYIPLVPGGLAPFFAHRGRSIYVGND